MAGPIEIKIMHRGPTPRILKREIIAALRECNRAIGEHWKAHFRAKHFTKAGAREYGYTPRAGEPGGYGNAPFWRSYTGRKQKQKHHTNPLVWSGQSRDFTTGADVRPTANRVRIVMYAPALNWKNPRSRIDMRKEMTTVSQQEANALVKLFEAELAKRLGGIHVIDIIFPFKRAA